MKQKNFMFAGLVALVIAAAAMLASMGASAQTIPGIPDSELAEAHVTKGCHLIGAASNVRQIFGTYALAVSGSGHIDQSFFPGGEPATADVGAVWCRFNREIDPYSDFMLVRYQSYSSGYVARKGFDLVVNAQNRATPDNPYTLLKKGALTLAIRKYGEVMALSGSTLASAAWYVPAQQQTVGDMMNRKVGGSAFVTMMFAMLCAKAPSC